VNRERALALASLRPEVEGGCQGWHGTSWCLWCRLVNLEFLYVPVLGETCKRWDEIHIASGDGF